MPLEQTTAARFTLIQGDNLDDLLEKMNTYAHPYSRVIYFDIPSLTAVIDLALQLVLTLDDVEGMSLDDEKEGLNEVSPKKKTSLSA